MFVVINGRLVSCDTKIRKMLVSLGYDTSSDGQATVMQFRNSITDLTTNNRVITDNDYETVVNELVSMCNQ